MIVSNRAGLDIPVEINSRLPSTPHPYFRQLAAIVSVFALTAGLGLAVKLAQERQSTNSKAGGQIVDFVKLNVSNQDIISGLVSFYEDGSIKLADKLIGLSSSLILPSS